MMNVRFHSAKLGFTTVELMVTILIGIIVSTTVGVFFVKLLTLHETEREEAYIREKLVDLCGIYADRLSIASSISNVSDQAFLAVYRKETGGVSFETGNVVRVSQLFSENTNGIMNLTVSSLKTGNHDWYFQGDDVPLVLLGKMRNLTDEDDDAKKVWLRFALNRMTADDDASAKLWRLRGFAYYNVKNTKGQLESRTTDVERIVRLWNHSGDVEE